MKCADNEDGPYQTFFERFPAGGGFHLCQPLLVLKREEEEEEEEEKIARRSMRTHHRSGVASGKGVVIFIRAGFTWANSLQDSVELTRHVPNTSVSPHIHDQVRCGALLVQRGGEREKMTFSTRSAMARR